MSDSNSIVGSQVGALMKLLERSRKDHCREVLEDAAEQADEIRRRARRQARERVSATVSEERARMDNAIRMVAAEIETEKRRIERQRDQKLIQAAGRKLSEVLTRRWSNDEDRRAWTEVTLSEAASVLRSKEWTLEHPPGWADEERDRAIELARTRFDATLKARATDDLSTGLRIHAQGVMVDMSLEGLLANQRIIEGELLAEFNRAAKDENS